MKNRAIHPFKFSQVVDFTIPWKCKSVFR